MDGNSWAVPVLGLVVTWICTLGIGLGVRLLLRRSMIAELLSWAYLIMGFATSLPAHLDHIEHIADVTGYV